jgi:hypothetical protein
MANATLASGAPGREAATKLTQAQAAALPQTTAAEIEYKKAQTGLAAENAKAVPGTTAAEIEYKKALTSAGKNTTITTHTPDPTNPFAPPVASQSVFNPVTRTMTDSRGIHKIGDDGRVMPIEGVPRKPSAQAIADMKSDPKNPVKIAGWKASFPDEPIPK